MHLRIGVGAERGVPGHSSRGRACNGRSAGDGLDAGLLGKVLRENLAVQVSTKSGTERNKSGNYLTCPKSSTFAIRGANRIVIGSLWSNRYPKSYWFPPQRSWPVFRHKIEFRGISKKRIPNLTCTLMLGDLRTPPWSVGCFPGRRARPWPGAGPKWSFRHSL